jgi:hypothetical protein
MPEQKSKRLEETCVSFAGNLKFGRWENIFNPARKHQHVVFKVFNHRDVMRGGKQRESKLPYWPSPSRSSDCFRR